jgi:peptidoglycan/xylan/chitin deacetylase (PgdA/CDA1 family)
MITLETIARRCAGTIRRLPVGRRLSRAWRRREAVSIVMYHGVTSQALPVPNWCQLPARAFEKQMDYLAGACRVLPLGEVLDHLEHGRPLPEGAACITFDDGFRNVATTAYPILRARGLPATVFLVTENLETAQPAWPDRLYYNLALTARSSITHGGRAWPLEAAPQRACAYRELSGRLKQLDNDARERALADLIDRLGNLPVPRDSGLDPMDWADVAGLASGGLVQFGSHTHTHPILSHCAPVRQHEELRRSRDILRERLGRAESFAYPNGGRADFTPETKRILRELDYRCGVTTITGSNPPARDRFELRRLGVGSETTLNEFEWMLMS